MNLDQIDRFGHEVELDVTAATLFLPKLYLRGLLLDGLRIRGAEEFLIRYRARGPRRTVETIRSSIEDMIEEGVGGHKRVNAGVMALTITDQALRPAA